MKAHVVNSKQLQLKRVETCGRLHCFREGHTPPTPWAAEGKIQLSTKRNLLDHVSLFAVGELEARKVSKEGHETHELVELQLCIGTDDLVDADGVVGQEWV